MSGADMKFNSTVPTMTTGKIYDPNDPSTFPSYPNPYGSALPMEASGLPSNPYGSSPPIDASDFPSNPATSSTYSGSPQGVHPTNTGNTLVGAQVPGRTQYTGAPEL